MIRHSIMMYDIPEVFQLRVEELNKNLSSKLYRNRRSTMFLMLVVNDLQWGTENKSFLATFSFPPEVPNLSLLQALEQLFSCPRAWACEVPRGTAQKYLRRKTALEQRWLLPLRSVLLWATPSVKVPCFLLAWLFVSRFCKGEAACLA